MKLVITDETDTPIGIKERDALTETDIYRVARLLIINSKGQLLLAQRALTKKKDPGVWGLAVEGTLEEGETYESNIRKEASEEIGIHVDHLQLGPKLRMTGKYNHYCQFFIYKADLETASLKLQDEELAAVQWYTPETLKQEVAANPQKFGYNFALILEAVRPYLGSKTHLDIDPRLNDIDDCLYRVALRVLIVQDNKVLLVQELPEKWWAFPGGGVDHGESIEATLAREVEEELGIPAKEVTSDFQIVHYNIGGVVNTIPRMNLFYKATIPKELLATTEHVAKWRWFSKEEFMQLDMHPSYDKAALVDVIFGDS